MREPSPRRPSSRRSPGACTRKPSPDGPTRSTCPTASSASDSRRPLRPPSRPRLRATVTSLRFSPPAGPSPATTGRSPSGSTTSFSTRPPGFEPTGAFF
jgi:hypothetical protein